MVRRVPALPLQGGPLPAGTLQGVAVLAQNQPGVVDPLVQGTPLPDPEGDTLVGPEGGTQVVLVVHKIAGGWKK